MPVEAANMNYTSLIVGGLVIFITVWWFIHGRGNYQGPVSLQLSTSLGIYTNEPFLHRNILEKLQKSLLIQMSRRPARGLRHLLEPMAIVFCFVFALKTLRILDQAYDIPRWEFLREKF